jgi:hypothetical protein
VSTDPDNSPKVSGLHRSTTQLVCSYLRRVQLIPGPEETFLQRDLPPETREMFDRFRENELFEQVEYDEDAEAHRWRLRPAVHDAIQRFSSPRQAGGRVSPCCHFEGFANLRDGGFECGLCGDEFDDFAVVEEVADAAE